jgi:hypothetical protein
MHISDRWFEIYGRRSEEIFTESQTEPFLNLFGCKKLIVTLW